MVALDCVRYTQTSLNLKNSGTQKIEPILKFCWLKPQNNKIYEDGFGEHSWFQSFIAEEVNSGPDNKYRKIVGQAIYFRSYSAWKGRTIKVEDLYVKREYRGRGVGSMLLKEVTKNALKENCSRVQWCVLYDNEPALNFHKHIGGKIQPEWRLCFERRKYENIRPRVEKLAHFMIICLLRTTFCNLIYMIQQKCFIDIQLSSQCLFDIETRSPRNKVEKCTLRHCIFTLLGCLVFTV